eukprot:6015666-Pyramimonas_sp.AAC.1
MGRPVLGRVDFGALPARLNLESELDLGPRDVPPSVAQELQPNLSRVVVMEHGQDLLGDRPDGREVESVIIIAPRR